MRWGWADEAFKTIISEAVGSHNVTDISSPPGTRKTYNVLLYAIENKMDMIASFPNHQNQATALAYIIRILERMGVNKPQMFVFDYAGIENYCLFYRPELLMKLLDKFRGPGESYEDAVANLLGEDMLFQILLLKGSLDAVEDLWLEVGRLINEYSVTRNRSRYLEGIRNIVEKRGQYEVCTGMCPVGLFAWFYRRSLYRLFSDPKIITWRPEFSRKNLASKYPKVARHIVVANPENFVENIEAIVKGRIDPDNHEQVEWILCPRFLLLAKVTMSPQSTRPTFISTRKCIFLVPHAGLDFLLSVVRRQLSITRVNKNYTLFLDEYDALLKPKTWPLIPLDVAKALVALAEEIIDTPEGEEVRGVVVDEYLKQYAKYVRDVLTRVIQVVENAVETRDYHPLASLFVEGAFSDFTETTVKTKVPIEYKPLGARVVHIKHFLRDDMGNLFQLLLNDRIYFYDLAQRDNDWVLRYREAKYKWRRLARTVRAYALRPTKTVRNVNGKNVRTFVLRRVPVVCKDVLPVLRDFVRVLLMAPRFAVFYIHVGDKDTVSVIRLASIDVQLYKLFSWARHAILTSATPVSWDAIVAGPNTEASEAAVFYSDYERVVSDVAHSLIRISSPTRLLYDIKEETQYTVVFSTYTDDFATELHASLVTGSSVKYNPKGIVRREIRIQQVSPITSVVRHYVELLKVHPISTLQPLVIPRKYRDRARQREERERIQRIVRDYAVVIQARYSVGDTVLVLVQNKLYTEVFRRLLGAIPCSGTKCGPEIDGAKISHYLAKKRIVLTWFRSRASRGIDLPYDFDTVIVVGSPYPRPQVLAYNKTDRPGYAARLDILMAVESYNTRETYLIHKTLSPRDIMSGIAELAQSIGRATRSVLRRIIAGIDAKPVEVLLPRFLKPKIARFAPYWFRAALVE